VKKGLKSCKALRKEEEKKREEKMHEKKRRTKNEKGFSCALPITAPHFLPSIYHDHAAPTFLPSTKDPNYQHLPMLHHIILTHVFPPKPDPNLPESQPKARVISDSDNHGKCHTDKPTQLIQMTIDR